MLAKVSAAVCLMFLCSFNLIAQSVYTVNTLTDLPDSNPGDGVCDNGTGSCSLRAAIEEANQTIVYDTIIFSLAGAGPHRIVLTAALPAITQPLMIDARTQTGYSTGNPQLILDGNLLGIAGIVLETSAIGSTISGLSIGNFTSAIVVHASQVKIQANHIGLEPDGLTPIPNTAGAIRIENTVGTVVGGSNAAQRNYIAGNNTLNSIAIQIVSSLRDTLSGNYIGLAPDGITAVGNRRGIVVEGSSRKTVVGGQFGTEGNYISGNTVEGILVRDAADSVQILGNVIGLNTLDDRTRNLQGIVLSGTGQGHRIGNGTLAYRNIISGQNEPGNSGINIQVSGNFIQGNFIGVSQNGDVAISNWYGITLNALGSNTIITDNIISGNGEGIRAIGLASNLTIQRNKIGTDVSGTLPLGNSAVGIRLNTINSLIGGTLAEGNLISANGDGFLMDGNTTGNIIQGNLIGTDITGNADLGNGRGFYLLGSDQNEIGSTSADRRNVISGNTQQGILLLGQCLNNIIQGNYIGLGLDGVTALGNTRGIELGGSSANNQIGGLFGTATNFISNNSTGLYLSTSGDDNIIEGNVFGLTTTEQLAGNSSGIWFTGSGQNQRIGSQDVQYRNIFSGNTQFGIEVFGGNNAQIIGNYFGTDFAGVTARPNNRAIRFLGSGSSPNVFDNNLVSGNTSGIELWNGPQGITITRNRIGIGTNGLVLPNGTGIRIQGNTTTQNIIGGSPANGNLIVGNTNNGIWSTGGAPANIIQYNRIGILPDNTPAGNGEYGIDIQDGSLDYLITHNLIAHNGISGIRLSRTVFNFPKRNRLSQNQIFTNGSAGIQLSPSGTNNNDLTDADDGANNLQNYPVISRTTSYNSTTEELSLEYFVPSDTAHSAYPITVEFYIDDGNRQGIQYLFSDVFTASDYLAFKPKALVVNVGGSGMTSTDIPTALAIDSLGNTSEFGSIIPEPATVLDVALCEGITDATLSASGAEPGGTYRWYTSPTSSTAIASGPVLMISNVLSDTIIYVANVSATNIESVRTPVSITRAPTPVATITASGSTTICQNTAVTLSGPAGFAAYSWSTGETTPTIEASSPGTYTLTVTSAAGCISATSDPVEIIVVACAGNPPVIAAENFTTAIGTQLSISILDFISDPENDLDLSTLRLIDNVTEQGAPVFIDDTFNLVIDYTSSPFIGTDALRIEICDLQGRCTQQLISIEVFSDIIVYNAVSPNQDDQNDFFLIEYIDELEQTRNNRVTIYNRWGDLVWTGTNYDNQTVSFVGKSNNNLDLPTGTYFYKIDFNGRRASLTGYLSLKR